MRPSPVARSPIVLLIAGTTLLRLAFAAATGLGMDESYMVTAGRVLSLGYFDHPPASWWLSWSAAHLFNTEAPWAVRLPFILLFALSQFLVWRITCLTANRRAGFWAVVALNLSPVFGLTTGTWVLPDGPLDAALLGAALCLLHALSPDAPPAANPKTTRWWAAAGICAGLALFAKYSAILTVGGAFLYLLTSRQHRRWLARPEPYLAAALALAVFSPVVIWNATHHWASFAFQGNRAEGLRFRPLLPLQVLAGEALFVLPWIWVPMMLLFVNGVRRGAGWSERLLVWLAAPPIVLFSVVSAWSSQRILYHWAAPGYLMLFPLLGDAIARHLDRPWVRHLLAGSAALFLASMAVIATQLQFDWLGSRLAVVMRSDPTPEGLDWTSLHDTLQARGLLPQGTVVGALNWRDAGKIGRALGPDATMLCLSTDSRQFGFAHPVQDFTGQDVLLLVLDPAEHGIEEAKHWFRTTTMLPGAIITLHGRVLRTVTVIRGTGLQPPNPGTAPLPTAKAPLP
jgi:4-amino-4-deoxy-L-arabinose transferase-like glycosyltransferase